MPATPSPALSLAAGATAVAVVGLALTEAHVPSGSPVGWLMLLIAAAGHLSLLRRDRPKEPLAVPFPVPRVWLGWVLVALALVGTTVLVTHHMERIFVQPVLPRASAQLGLVTQAVARITTDRPLYAAAYERQGYMELNGNPPGLLLAFAAARANALDWRFASLAGVALAGLLIALGTSLLANSAWRPADDLDGILAVAATAAGILPLVLHPTLEFLQWGHSAPLWPLLVLFGLSLALGWQVMAGLAAGLLSTMTLGWLPMLAPVGALLWRGRSRGALVAMVLPPLMAYGAWRLEGEALGHAMLGNVFGEGAGQAESLLGWREATLHGLTDFLGLRPGVYLLGLVAVGGATVFAAGRDRTPQERINAVALAHFALIACGPVAHFFHWTAHALLLAGLVPAAAMAAPLPVGATAQPSLRFSARELLLALGGGGALAAMAVLPVRLGLFDTLDRRADFREGPQDQLWLGWNVDQGTYTWARDTAGTTGFWLDRPQNGLLELQLGSHGGEFTAWNPVRISINGAPKGTFFIAPGKEGFARVPLAASDVNVGFNAVEIVARWTRTPRSLNIYPDDRLLSFKYRGMRFIPELALSPANPLVLTPPRSLAP